MNAILRRFQWTSLVAAMYFGLLWLVLADQHRYWGALVICVVGLLLSAFAARTLALLAGSRKTSDASSEPRVGATVPVYESIGTYSAEPEHREHQRARFLGALGHELRNPLNSVTGFSDMLLGRVDGELNTEQERSVRTIRASAERLLRLVSTLVDQAKLEAGTLRLQEQWVAPDELITEAIGFARSRAEGTFLR